MVILNCPPEAEQLAREEILQYIAESGGQRPSRVNGTYDPGTGEAEVELICNRPTISHTRRITGYLSNLNNFNGSKKAEERDRTIHASM